MICTSGEVAAAWAERDAHVRGRGVFMAAAEARHGLRGAHILGGTR
jgi:hypothetical protein